MRTPSSKKTATASCCRKDGLKRGPWTAEEDEILKKFIREQGEGGWRSMPEKAGLLRCGKSCRLRWMNYLRPSLKRGHITPDEEDLIIRLHRLLGNRWSLIAGRIPGRTDNEIKNYWNTHLSKKLLRQGIDPTTHKPLHSDITKNTEASPSFTTNDDNNPHRLEPYGTWITAVCHDDDDGGSGSGGVKLSENNNDDDHQQINNNYNYYSDIEDFDFCYDDTFSSFLNSLINEDPFGNSSHQPDPQQDCSDNLDGVDGTSVMDSDAPTKAPENIHI